MAQFPQLPLFTDAYLADTRHLNAQQHGAYLLLLMMAWRTHDCAIPDDDATLARWASMDVRTWKNNRSTILAFWHPFTDPDGQQKWRQLRLLDERKRAEYLRSKNVAAGKTSALKRKERHSTTVATEPQPKANPQTQTHSVNKLTEDIPPTPKPKPKGKTNANPRISLAQFAAANPNAAEQWAQLAIERYPTLTEPDILDELRNFWEYWNSPNAVGSGLKADWDQTWRGWVARHANDRRPSNRSRQAPSGGYATAFRAVMASRHGNVGQHTGQHGAETTQSTNPDDRGKGDIANESPIPY